MTRFVGEPIEFKVQILDASDDPAPLANPVYIIYDENDNVFASANMAHIADGVFTVTFIPDAVGEWTAYAQSWVPIFKKSLIYQVEN